MYNVFCNKIMDNNGDLLLKRRKVIEVINYLEFGLLLKLYLLFLNVIYFTNVNSVSPPTWEVFFIMLIFQMDKLWCIEMLMLAFPQVHADTATCSERAQSIHGPFGCFQNNILQNIQVPECLKETLHIYALT